MSQGKRDRQKANRAARIEAEIAEERRTRRRRQTIKWASIIAAVLLAAFLYNRLTGNGSDDVEVVESIAGCPELDGSSPATTAFSGPQPMCIDEDTLYVASFSTSAGDFEIALDPELDPVSVNNFVVLALFHAYDGTRFHRVIEDFVIQGGDVEDQFGVGTPGYRFVGRFPDDDFLAVGSVAMANSGNPSSNGSQFFIVTGQQGADLDPLYSPLGRVIAGLEDVLTIAATPTETREVGGRDRLDVPVDDVVVDAVTIREATPDDVDAYEDASSDD